MFDVLACVDKYCRIWPGFVIIIIIGLGTLISWFISTLQVWFTSCLWVDSELNHFLTPAQMSLSEGVNTSRFDSDGLNYANMKAL